MYGIFIDDVTFLGGVLVATDGDVVLVEFGDLWPPGGRIGDS